MAEAVRAQAAAETARAAIAEASKTPERPPDCGTPQRSGVKLRDPLPEAVKKYDIALYLANQRIARCWAWDETYRKGLGQ